VVAVEAGPVKHRLEVTQGDSSQRLTHARHERGRRSRIIKGMLKICFGQEHGRRNYKDTKPY
jgi:hypothetical protein